MGPFVDLSQNSLVSRRRLLTHLIIAEDGLGRDLALGHAHLHLVLFFIEQGAAVEELVKDVVELVGHPVLQVLAMHWVLLHLVEDMALENVAEEAVVGFLEALKVVLEDIVLRLKHLHLAQRQVRIEPVVDLVELEDLAVDLLHFEISDQVGDIVFADG